MSEVTNPSVRPGEDVPAARTRIPMTNSTRRLQIPEVPGWKHHWFVDANIERALQAGYEFVRRGEVSLNQLNVATSKGVDGNVDLGSNVRVVGGKAENGNTEYLTLMKIKQEWWDEDHRDLEQRNMRIMSTIFNREEIMGADEARPDDRKQMYVRDALFNRPARKAK